VISPVVPVSVFIITSFCSLSTAAASPRKIE
jgi:hypothetical protein